MSLALNTHWYMSSALPDSTTNAFSKLADKYTLVASDNSSGSNKLACAGINLSRLFKLSSVAAFMCVDTQRVLCGSKHSRRTSSTKHTVSLQLSVHSCPHFATPVTPLVRHPLSWQYRSRLSASVSTNDVVLMSALRGKHTVRSCKVDEKNSLLFAQGCNPCRG